MQDASAILTAKAPAQKRLAFARADFEVFRCKTLRALQDAFARRFRPRFQKATCIIPQQFQRPASNASRYGAFNLIKGVTYMRTRTCMCGAEFSPVEGKSDLHSCGGRR